MNTFLPTLAVSPLATAVNAASTGVPYAIPTDLTLIGRHIYLQCLVTDPAIGAALPITVSDAVDVAF